ncbi:MAG TPA: response regulator transcription factor [Candidatus Angelobacter sp.]|nr:response regulator transcription factor [Candidatus Angelobacter sp.]
MKKQILLVDDNAVIRKYLHALIEQRSEWGICGEAVNGADALLKIQSLQPDLVILDLCMPIMDGLETAKRLLHMRPALPIVLFSSYDSDEIHRKAMSAGIREVVSKGDPFHVLTQAIEKLLSSPPPPCKSSRPYRRLQHY